jgi:hypothetical protein
MKSGYVSPAEEALGAAIGRSSVEQRIAAATGLRQSSDERAVQVDLVRLDGGKVRVEYGEVGHE